MIFPKLHVHNIMEKCARFMYSVCFLGSPSLFVMNLCNTAVKTIGYMLIASQWPVCFCPIRLKLNQRFPARFPVRYLLEGGCAFVLHILKGARFWGNESHSFYRFRISDPGNGE